MPECTHCHKYYFGNPDQCPECHFDFKRGRVVTPVEMAELQRQRVEEQRVAIEAEQQRQRERVRREQELAVHEANLKRQKDELRQQALIQNPRYEYATVYIADSRTGILDKNSLDSTLEKYSGNGWRLHSVLTNEAGKNASAIGVGGVTVGSNSTMDVTILIFERCIKLAGQ